mgnify:CR=1 FL=1
MPLIKLRYEIYIPTCYNDKTLIEVSKYREIKNKLQKKFGGLSVHPATIQGSFFSEILNCFLYDNCFRYEILVEKLPENEEFFEEFKKELLQMLNQEEIFMIYTETNWV